MKQMKQRYNRKGKLFLPDFAAESTAQIDFKYLRKQGIKACFFDLDHTILDQGTYKVSLPILKQLRGSGIKVYIATNRRYAESLEKISKQIHADGIMHAESGGVFKPRRVYYEKLIRLAGIAPENIAMIGDRIIQDIFGANRAGINTILVGKLGPITPIDKILIIPDLLVPKLFAWSYRNV